MSRTLNLAGRTIHTELPAFIMGIVNVTPDSFWEGSRAGDTGLELALSLIEAGADILDIGGESTRPGSAYVDENEEIGRIVPLIKQIRAQSSIPISVDTRKSGVLKAAIEAGADLLNDVSALADDETMASVAARLSIPVVLMHKKGIPETMQQGIQYDDVVSEVCDFLAGRVQYALDAGIIPDRIILDPGIGFGKRHEDNVALIRNIDRLLELGYPVMMALSRKSSIGQMTGKTVDKRMAGSLCANMFAVQKGAGYLRVHDVEETRDMLAVLQELEPRWN